MNASESSLLSRKIINRNPSLKQVWKDVHRVQHLEIFAMLLHIFTFLITANKKNAWLVRRKSWALDNQLPAHNISFGLVMKFNSGL